MAVLNNDAPILRPAQASTTLFINTHTHMHTQREEIHEHLSGRQKASSSPSLGWPFSVFCSNNKRHNEGGGDG